MKKKTMRFLAGVAMGALSASVAHAVPWTLTGVTFDDGGTATGSFDYDAGTNTFSTITVISTAGSIFGGMTYDSQHPDLAPTNSFLTLISAATGDGSGQTTLQFDFDAPLTEAGGTVSLAGLGESICTETSCIPGSPFRDITAGSVTSLPPAAITLAQPSVPANTGDLASSVPEPATVALLGIGLAGLGVARKRAKAM